MVRSWWFESSVSVYTTQIVQNIKTSAQQSTIIGTTEKIITGTINDKAQYERLMCCHIVSASISLYTHIYIQVYERARLELKRGMILFIQNWFKIIIIYLLRNIYNVSISIFYIKYHINMHINTKYKKPLINCWLKAAN